MADKKRGNDDLSLVGAGTLIEGKIKTDGSIRVDGTLIGEIVAKASAAIGLTGTVEGGVMAKNVTIAGKVKGTVTATEKLTLEGKSITRGDIRASKLIVDEGATFDGQCAMTSQNGATKEGSSQK
ncbi:MAG: polymer-forming cytoskeletal protein [Ignavibacteria bacterium]|nr:polymer-forming cytoskeletal protein [Ignavibacteria bacterium]